MIKMALGKHYSALACVKPKINWLSTSVCVKATWVNVVEISSFIVSLLLVVLLLMLLLAFCLSFSCVSCCFQNKAAVFYVATEGDLLVERANGSVQKLTTRCTWKEIAPVKFSDQMLFYGEMKWQIRSSDVPDIKMIPQWFPGCQWCGQWSVKNGNSSCRCWEFDRFDLHLKRSEH